jgi:RNA polymerase sigma-70 factor (ECF subfamily)
MTSDTTVKPLRAFAWSDSPMSPTAADGRTEWADDWALVQQCASGDEDACTLLVTDHQRMVYQLSLHLLGDPQEALDLSQEVFLKVFRTLHQFRGHSALRTWIYRIVVTQASNRRRWWRRRHQADQVALDEHVAAHGDVADNRRFATPDEVVAERQVAGQVWRALESLPFEQRTILLLREIDGLSYEEIGYSLGVAVGTVKSRLARAREQLRSALRGGAS